MQIVIDIPKEVKQTFDNAKNEDLYGNYYDRNSLIGKAIQKGIPLEQYEVRQKMFYYLNGVADGLHESRRDTIDVLDKIRAEIEAKCCITVGRENDAAITLHDVFEIIDKYKAETE